MSSTKIRKIGLKQILDSTHHDTNIANKNVFLKIDKNQILTKVLYQDVWTFKFVN